MSIIVLIMKDNLNGKTVAKNSLFLYMRMGCVMLITLYTSRVVFNQLGVEDYGIYNVVAGFVTMFSFFTSSLSNATQRFLSYQIGRGNLSSSKEIFSAGFIIFFLFSIIMFIAIEFIGYWFLVAKMTIPENRLYASKIVLHISAITTFFLVNTSVFSSAILAREKMKIYAYVGLVEAFLRLIIAYLLSTSSYDKLIFYSVLYLLSTIIISASYIIYSFKFIPECCICLKVESKVYKKLFGFIGWNTYISVVDIVNQQGVNMLLNIFYGPIVNAARGISFQIYNAVQNFSQNIYTAIRPQVTKAYSCNDMDYFVDLFYKGAKYSYYFMLIISVPIIVNIEYILSIWMGKVPDYTDSFSILIIIYVLVNTLNNSTWSAMQAQGELKMYSLVGSSLFLLYFPVSYLLMKFGLSPIYIYICYVLFRVFYLFASFSILCRKINYFDWQTYLSQVLFPIIIVSIFSFGISVYINMMFNDINFPTFIYKSALYCFITSIIIFFIGLNRFERSIMLNFIKNKIYKKWKF